MKVALKTMSKVLEGKQEDQNQATQQTTQSKIINLAIGLLSIFAIGLSLFTIAQIGLAATCAAVAALVLYGCFKDEEIGKNINDKLDEIAESTTDFIVSNIEKLIPQQSCQA
jgi:Na+/H+ antiporter NhaB